MEYLFYVRLIGFTAGTLLFLFLLVLLAGLRRPRLFESLLFFTGICLFIFYAGGLLAINTEIYFASPPIATMKFSIGLMLVGLGLFPACLLHSCFAFVERLGVSSSVNLPRRFFSSAAFVTLYLSLRFIVSAFSSISDWSWNIFEPGSDLGKWGSIFLGVLLTVCAAFQLYFSQRVRDKSQSGLHLSIAVQLLAISVLAIAAWAIVPFSERPYSVAQALATIVMLAPIAPATQLGYFFARQRILPAGAQRNLIFTVTAGFLALLYLTLARRLSVWLDPPIPPEATVSILLFVLVIFFEPLQRRMGAILQRAFRAEAEQLQRLTAEVQHVARAGDLNELVSFAESRIRESFSLSGVRISLHDGPARPATVSGNVQRFILRNGPAEIGVLEAYFFGQALSGETHAALDYLAEQLPAAIDLCRLLDEKLRLERELAERERLALLGQMAASVSHNLRNPLSSIKTLLQVQLENPGLPASARPDCEKAIAEVDRLNTKLTQLLRYAKPAVRAPSGITAVVVDAAAIAAQTVSLLQHEAERRGVSLSLDGASEKIDVSGTEESLSDVLSNLIVNAIEAVPAGGSVRVSLARRDAAVVLEILDDGPGIPEYVRPRIFQPFFTTKPTGTGLGLAIVEKRLAEFGATIDCESPVANARGTRFVVKLKCVGAGL
jgi:signal transduction histidine kinase